MKVHTAILVALLTGFCFLGKLAADIDLKKIAWNDRSNCLDMLVEGDPEDLDRLFCDADNILLRFNGKELETILAGMSRGLFTLLDRNPSLPDQILILLDIGEIGSRYYYLYEQQIEKIVGQYGANNGLNLLLFSDQLSNLQCISASTFRKDLTALKSQVKFGSKADFISVFRSLQRIGKNYSRIFLLSPLVDPRYLQDVSIYPSFLNLNHIKQNQIIPVSVAGIEYNTDFYTYLESLNLMPLRRDSPELIPNPDQSEITGLLKIHQLGLRYELPAIKAINQVEGKLELLDAGKVLASENLLLSNFDPTINRMSTPINGALMTVVTISLVLLGFFYFLIPMYNRFYLKRDHIFTYAEVKREGLNAIDPLKLCRIQMDDQVVKFGEKIMLLESWKYIRKNKSNLAAPEDYGDFFQAKVPGDIFSQKKGILRILFPLFIATLMATLVTFLYGFLFHTEFVNKGLWRFSWSNILFLPAGIPVLSTFFFTASILTGTYVVYRFQVWSVSPQLREIVRILLLILLASGISVLMTWISSGIVVPTSMRFFIYSQYLAIWMVILTNGFARLRRSLQSALWLGLSLYLSFWLLNRLLFSSFSDLTAFYLTFLLAMSFIALYLTLQKPALKDLRIELMNGSDFNLIYYDLDESGSLNREGMTIGRNPDAPIYVKWDPGVKYQHAKIWKHDNIYHITPLEGDIFLNDDRISQTCPLSPYDEVSLTEEKMTILRLIQRS